MRRAVRQRCALSHLSLSEGSESRETSVPQKPSGDLLFEPVQGGTKLSVRLEPNPVGPLKLIPPLAGMIGQRIWDKRLLRIKAALEGEPKLP